MRASSQILSDYSDLKIIKMIIKTKANIETIIKFLETRWHCSKLKYYKNRAILVMTVEGLTFEELQYLTIQFYQS